MMVRIACAALALFLMVSSPLVAAPAQLLEALGRWNLDYGETHCIAMRDYGSREHPITLGIIPAPNGETYELLIVRKRSGPLFAEELQGSVDFGTRPIKAWLLHYGAKGSKVDIYKYRISAAEMTQAQAAKSVTFHLKGASDTAFKLDVMPVLLEGLQKCTDDLKDYWSIGRERNGSVATPANGDVRRVFTSNDYPAEAMNRGQEGTAQFLLLINEKGFVVGCHVVKASGVPVLDAMGCIVLQERAKFKPARDPSGKPVRSSTVTPPVSWRIAS